MDFVCSIPLLERRLRVSRQDGKCFKRLWRKLGVPAEVATELVLTFPLCTSLLPRLPHLCSCQISDLHRVYSVSIGLHSTECCGTFHCSYVRAHLPCVKCCFSFFPWGNMNQIWPPVSFHLVRNHCNKSSISSHLTWPSLQLIVFSVDTILEMISLLRFTTGGC